ncbi:MAG: Nif3-like dinuclear metal center hexameric protein [Clostridia bacterium]|nr:Nif3-like dinuclear metal center hexameric protein [Clostridia bacterium]
MIRLDERLGAIAEMVTGCIGEGEARAADIGCDHGYLTAYLLEACPRLTMQASDVSAPSLEKARKLMAQRGLTDRVTLTVADGLDALDGRMDAVVIAGMGAQTIVQIVRAGREKLRGAKLIVQANVDLPLLRTELAHLGFTVERECYTQAGGRQYVTMQACEAEAKALAPREALLGTAVSGVKDDAQRAYYSWQRGVRVRELERIAGRKTNKAMERLAQCLNEMIWIGEAIGMKACTVRDIETLVGGIAPFELAEEWDNVGLLVGWPEKTADRVLVALDVTPAVIDEAKSLGAQLILTHHPVMFSARKRMTSADHEGRMLLDMAQAGISLIAAHTNLDAAPGGVNDTLMTLMGAKNVRGEGFIRVGDLPEGTTLGSLRTRAQQKLGGVVRAYGGAETPVHVLGCCSGAGSGEIAAAKALGADCFITGEVKHDRALTAMDMGVCLLEAGHYETENPVCEVLASALQNAADALKYRVTVFCSKVHPFE